MNTNKKSLEFCVIGCGRLGISLAVFLSKQGFIPKAFSSKSHKSAQKAMEFAGSGQVFKTAVEAAKACDLVFITTPDTIIEPVCEKIAMADGFNSNSVVYHLSGALSSSILLSAKKAGASTGSIHPLQAFAPYEDGQKSPFKGINMSIEGDDKAVEFGKEIVNALKANSFTIPTHAKTVYHASAVVASNYLVTLEHFALELLKQADLSEDNAYEILEPLIMGTLNNIKARGSINALTGPVARGDDVIVSRHLSDIDKKLPQFSDLYRLLGKHTLDIAAGKGEISDDARQKLTDLFKF
ncbi:Rossmann-like and DUF2520 domain-containing protein [Desulfobacula phenolica]|uniref:Predicted oxidoreductase, contains short-chain dehydrogenase (SDR) and DUF2520 domains n=1 Tax=Desulfobacula phenolica TaxID=90732 RepID=A0A1H2K1C2_9BACT|nr:Rossmann-like and DUF2520 domain-containing protein [Desulfobacula phenolica]SDU62208.1 Predicted oxidoreductase, contains short-chain dehydrogenase (SDR) and DUF2520 domains [Desulfobacula phenolica]